MSLLEDLSNEYNNQDIDKKRNKVPKKRLSKKNFIKESDKKIKKIKKKQKNKTLRKCIKWAVFLGFIVFGIFIFRTYYPTYKAIKKEVYAKLSNMNEDTFKRAGNTYIYDKDDNIIGEIGNEQYTYVSSEDISDYIKNGYIAKEDKSFMEHHGVDYKAILRATYYYVKNKGEITQGGSTITQQVIKNNLLSQEQTFKRKITEILLAGEIEKKYNKSQIMEFYCNSNYYGNGCYGVESASQYYFGHSAKDVTISEAAILVATSQLPNTYNPVADYELCIEKRDKVLYEMYNEDYITEEEYHNAVDEEPVIVRKSEIYVNNNYLSSYALHCATLQVMKINGFEFKYTFTSSEEYEQYETDYYETYNNTMEDIRIGGFQIHTSLDQDIQKTLQKNIDENLSEFDERGEDDMYALQSAGVCVDNQTNMVVAIVGGRNDEGYFNRGYQATRQSGSAIKPLLDYGPAVNEGVVTPASVMTDKELDIDGFKPKNANGIYAGDMTVRDALLSSTNTIAVQLFINTGSDLCLSYLDAMHFSSLAFADTYSTSVSIGGFTNGVTVVDMAKGYSTLANQGQFSENTCIVSMENYDGSIKYEASDETTEVYDVDAAFITTDMMRAYFENEKGPGYKYKTDDQIYAGKTGTTNDTKDVWFCGFSAYYSTAIWIGYDLPREMEDITSGTYPTKIFTDFMQELHADKKLRPKEFTIPSTVLLSDGYETKKVDYKTDVYNSRPEGWDYISNNLQYKADERRRIREEELNLENAKTKVDEFEEYQIESIDDALNWKETYNATVEEVEKVSNGDEKAALMSRVAKKYEMLSTDVINTWNDAIDAYNAKLQEEEDRANELAAQESIEEAQAQIKQYYIDVVNWYIDCLNARTVYTDFIDTLIEYGEKSLENVKDYDEYDSLVEDFNTAKERALKLPTETELITTEAPTEATTEATSEEE